MAEKIITIGLDARLAGRKNAGLGRYINNLALRLPFTVPDNYRLVYFFHDKSQWSEIIALLPTLAADRNIKAQDILQKIKLVYTPIRHYSFAEQIKLPALFAQEKLDLLHIPHFNAPYCLGSQKYVLTIHDLLWHEKKGLAVTTLAPWQYYFKYYAYRFLTNHVIKKSRSIIVISQNVKKTLLRFYPRAAAKTHLIYNGVGHFPPLLRTPTFKIPLPSQFLLYVGNLYPHKNVDLVLRALTQEPSLHLVIVSARDAFWQKTETFIKQLHLQSQVTFLGQVSDQQLQFLYQQAQALVQPSLSEGFGLTGVEALLSGTPVIASDIPVFHEIYGSVFTAFDPYDQADFLTAVKKSASLKANPSWQRLATRQASRYSWQTMTAAVIQVYQQALS